MHITDIMRGDSPTFSFEFFPPKTPAAAELLYQTIRDLESYMPHFVSVTYGAGGSTRDLTHDLVERIQQPGVLGELFGGILLGNLMIFGLNWAEPLKTSTTIAALAELGFQRVEEPFDHCFALAKEQIDVFDDRGLDLGGDIADALVDLFG